MAVDVGEGLKVSFRVACGRAGVGGGLGAEISHAGAPDLDRSVDGFDEQRVGFLLMPFDAAEFAIDAQAEVVFFANGNLRRVKNAFGAIVESEQHVAIVIESATFDERSEIGGEFADF